LLSDTDTEQGESHDSVAQRSSRDTLESIAPDLSSMSDMASSVQRTATDSAVGPQSTSPDTREQYEQRYGVDVNTPGQADRLQRLEQSNTLETVQRWADEGVPIGAMGIPSKMQAFRQRKGTPVPWDIEDQNEASKRRNTSAVQRATRENTAGDTQVPDSVRDVVSSPGQSVDAALRKPVESEIGQSLDHARVHRSPAADAACDQLNARAFTVDNHVAVRSDQPDPSTPAGQHLMSHELTHVAQQTGGAISLLPDAGALKVDPDPRLEQEAEETAQRVMQGGELGIQRLQDTDVHVQRMQSGGGPSRNLQPGEGPSSQQNIQPDMGYPELVANLKDLDILPPTQGEAQHESRRQESIQILNDTGIAKILCQNPEAGFLAIRMNRSVYADLRELGCRVPRLPEEAVERLWKSDILEQLPQSSVVYNTIKNIALLNSDLISCYRGVEGRSRGNRLCHGNRYPRLR